MNKTLVLFALAALVAAAAQAQTSLKLPQSSRDYVELLKNSESDECPGCGVVTQVRGMGAEVPGAPRPPAAGLPSTGTPLGGEGAPSTPVFARETREYSESLRQPKPAYYMVTVRFFDGSLGQYQQFDEPTVQRGDRVRVTQDRVEPAR